MALESEAQGKFDNLPVIFTGVGKVNASYHLLKAIHHHQPSHIINLGSAGSNYFSAGTVVHCRRFVQRDMNATALGFELYSTPFDEAPATELQYGNHIAPLPEAVCGTGDSFYTEGKNSSFNIVDMEAYALAKTCLLEKVPFTCIKFITDGADGTAAKDWNDALTLAAEKLRFTYDSIKSQLS